MFHWDMPRVFGYPFGFGLSLFGFWVFGVRDLSLIQIFINWWDGWSLVQKHTKPLCYHLLHVNTKLWKFKWLRRCWESCTGDSSWDTFANLASIYAKASLYSKAEAALKSLEEKMNPHKRDSYHFLISLYAHPNVNNSMKSFFSQLFIR